jgi:SpoVK/Ycf46/Vps4 family AAA+-type ATPase
MQTKTQIKSLMLYGPSGSGKTHAVEAVAHELGALLIHLSPAKLRGQWGGKQGPTKLVHMVMKVATDPAMQPCIIYIDECEQFFSGGKKNKDKDGPSRFKKDFLTYKNQAIGPEHRVMIIGTSKSPENGEIKDLKGFFDKFLFMPYPDYASRVLIWKHYLVEKIREGITNTQAVGHISTGTGKFGAPPLSAAQIAQQEQDMLVKVRIALEKLDISSLANVSEGYTAGSIARTIRIVVTHRRVAMIKLRPLNNLDFLDNLSFQDVSYQDDQATFLDFTRTITGVFDRREKIEKIIGGVDKAEKGDKKGGKKK